MCGLSFASAGAACIKAARSSGLNEVRESRPLAPSDPQNRRRVMLDIEYPL